MLLVPIFTITAAFSHGAAFSLGSVISFVNFNQTKILMKIKRGR